MLNVRMDPSNYEKAFNYLDMMNSWSSPERPPYEDGLLENNLYDISANQGLYYATRGNNHPAYVKDLQADKLLKNLYTATSQPNGLLENRDYKMNDLGKFVAGEDGKISLDELAALDKNGDSKISQEEYDAKEAEMNSNEADKPINNNFMKTMMQFFMQMMMQMMMQMFGGGFNQRQY